MNASNAEKREKKRKLLVSCRAALDASRPQQLSSGVSWGLDALYGVMVMVLEDDDDDVLEMMLSMVS